MSAFTIAPVGTCRIHTPLRTGLGRYPIELQLGRNFGFVHTTSEALQQVRFMYGRCEIPADVQRVTFRPSISAQSQNGVHTPADLYLVEISSRKLLTVDGYPIQINYTGRHFSDFFADRARTRMFWSMASEERLADRRALLERDSAFRSLPADDRELLARILRRDLTDAEMESELEQLADLVGKDRLVFVTHVNATTPDNTPIEQRSRLIAAMDSIAYRMGVPCFDPTTLMLQLGQSAAMENDGLDLTHYTERFAEMLCADWYERYVRPRLGASAQQAEAALAKLDENEAADQIEMAWESGEVREASRRVREVLRRHPGLSDHVLLLARMQSELGDYEGSIALLESARTAVESGGKAEQMLMRCHFELGRFEQSYSLAVALLADEIETPEIVRVAAESATKLGNTDAAVSCWKRLFRISGDVGDAANTVLGLLKSNGDADAAVRWAKEVRESCPSHGGAFATLWQQHVAAGDRLSLYALASEAADVDDVSALALVRDAAECGLAVAGATLAVARALGRSSQSAVTAWITMQPAAWLAQGAAALEAGRFREAAEWIQARCILDANANDGIRAQRMLERALRLEVRAALLAGNYQRVLDVTDVAMDAQLDFPDLDALRGRAADALGDSAKAMLHLKKAAQMDDAPVAAKVYFARVALRNDAFGEAIDAYDAVLADESADEGTRQEAERRLVRLCRRSIRAARELLAGSEHDAAWALLSRVERSWPDMAEIQQEKKRVLSYLHNKIRALDPASAQERLALGEEILRLMPGDLVGLRAAAVGAMRLHRFEQALAYWQALKDRSDNTDQFDGHIQKCIVLVNRASRKKAA